MNIRKLLSLLAPLMLLLLPLLFGGCTTTSRVEVSSTPAGARILIDGVDSGQQTPSNVQLSTSKSAYEIRLEKGGFNSVSRQVKFATDVDVIGADEAVGSICCAPCCCGLPLLRLLRPVSFDSKFVPARIDTTLEVAGQGARLRVSHSPFEVYLDGKLVALLEGDYLVTSPGDHEIEIRATGCRSYERAIRVDPLVYQVIEVELEVEGQGLLVSGSPDGAKVYLDDQFQGNVGDVPRRVRAQPGPHMLRVELEGWRPWQDVVQVAADRYQEIAIALVLEGQGILVRKPEGLSAKTPEIQILVDGTLRASAFDQPVRIEPGDHEVEIRVTGRDPRTLRVSVAKDGWLELEPGPKSSSRGKPQVQLDSTGVRIIASDEFEDAEPADLQILVDGALRAQSFGRIIALEPGEYDVEVRLRGCQPWSQRVRVTRKQVLDVWPSLRKD